MIRETTFHVFPIPNYHVVDGTKFSGLSELTNAAETLQSGGYVRRKICRLQLIALKPVLFEQAPWASSEPQ